MALFSVSAPVSKTPLYSSRWMYVLIEWLTPKKLISHMFLMEKLHFRKGKQNPNVFCRAISFSLIIILLIILVYPSIQRCKCVWACPCEQLWVVGIVCMHEVIPYQPWDYGILRKVNLHFASVPFSSWYSIFFTLTNSELGKCTVLY